MITNKVNNEQSKLVTLTQAKYGLGQLVSHKLFNYRGVIVDIDPVYLGSEAWYDEVAVTRPPKDIPWYKVLVNDSRHETYVAEQNLQADFSDEGINHPLLASYFDEFDNGHYINSKWRTH
jgi:heat shock protein HspQ